MTPHALIQKSPQKAIVRRRIAFGFIVFVPFGEWQKPKLLFFIHEKYKQQKNEYLKILFLVRQLRAQHSAYISTELFEYLFYVNPEITFKNWPKTRRVALRRALLKRFFLFVFSYDYYSYIY